MIEIVRLGQFTKGHDENRLAIDQFLRGLDNIDKPRHLVSRRVCDFRANPPVSTSTTNK